MVSELDESVLFPLHILEKNSMVNMNYSNKYICIFTFIFTIALTVHPAHSLQEYINIQYLVARSIQKIPTIPSSFHIKKLGFS